MSGKEVRKRWLKSQLLRLDRMIAEAIRPQDREMFRSWRVGLINTMKKEGVKMPTAKTKIEEPFKVTAEHQKKALAYLKAHNGKRIKWGTAAQAIGVSRVHLGRIVKALLEDGAIEEPGGEGSMAYNVVRGSRPKVVNIGAKRAEKMEARRAGRKAA